jgi:hypothetical protein
MTLEDIFPPAQVLMAKPPVTDVQLRAVAAEANGAIQRLQDLAEREPRDAARIRFPRGYLREVGRWRLALRFVRTNTVRNNVADTLMVHDVHAWVLKRTDLAGHARDMVVKSSITVLGGIAEALLIDATSPPMGLRQKVASRVRRLNDEATLDGDLARDLSWLWDIRNRQHLHGLPTRDFDVYTLDDHPRAESSVAELITCLQQRAGAAAA